MRQKLKELMADNNKILRLYGLGALLFFIGLGTIQGANRFFGPSLRQEVYVLAGLIVGGCGFLISMFAQVLLIIYRFRNMGKRR